VTARADDRGASGGTLLFFAVTYAITWTLQLPAVLAQRGVIAGPVDRFMPLVGLGALGPLLAAVLVARFAQGGGGVRALFARLRIWRVGAGWYAVALGYGAAASLVGTAVYLLFHGGGDVQWLYPPRDAQRIAALVIFPIGEEVGWRGFALPRLQARYGALPASLLVGVGWGLWHVPMFLIAGISPVTFLVSGVMLLAGSILFTWIYNHTKGSLLLAILVHAGAHLNNPNQVVPANITPLVIYTVAVCAFAGLALLDRKAWSAR
jgi:uncharacterized protein